MPIIFCECVCGGGGGLESTLYCLYNPLFLTSRMSPGASFN